MTVRICLKTRWLIFTTTKRGFVVFFSAVFTMFRLLTTGISKPLTIVGSKPVAYNTIFISFFFTATYSGSKGYPSSGTYKCWYGKHYAYYIRKRSLLSHEKYIKNVWSRLNVYEMYIWYLYICRHSTADGHSCFIYIFKRFYAFIMHLWC